MQIDIQFVARFLADELSRNLDPISWNLEMV